MIKKDVPIASASLAGKDEIETRKHNVSKMETSLVLRVLIYPGK